MTDGSTIRVLLADDHAVLRAGLQALLNAEEDIEVIGEAENGRQAVEMAHSLRPDVILMDVTMPGIGGLEATRRIKADHPEIQVLALTMHDDASYLRDILKAGGSGYVLKEAASSELLSAIRAVRQGGTYLHASHTKLLLDEMLDEHHPHPVAPDAAAERYKLLSEREAQIFKLVALGHRNSEIADLLHLSVKTVETYKARLMQKLDLHTRAALVRYALELGILEDEMS
ncbi:MAG: response regulator transcription factor [Anaerolineae bacterium]